jgi:phosphoribosylglycinamide formyltransferase-1
MPQFLAMPLSAKQLAQSTRRRERLVEMCGTLPEVHYETVGNSHIAFRVRKKIFAYYLFDHHGDGIIAFCCKSSLSEQRRLVRDDSESFFVPAYLGARGWIAIRLDLDTVDWETVSDLARRAFQSIAPRKLAALIE